MVVLRLCAFAAAFSTVKVTPAQTQVPVVPEVCETSQVLEVRQTTTVQGALGVNNGISRTRYIFVRGQEVHVAIDTQGAWANIKGVADVQVNTLSFLGTQVVKGVSTCARSPEIALRRIL